MPRSIEREELRKLLKAGAQLVEVLAADEFEDEHLPGAISIPLREIDRQASARLERDKTVIVYCWDCL